jgi:hypothetical protein
VKACQDTARSPLAAITSVIVCKHIVQQPFPGGGLAYISRPDPMYLWAVRLLLERVSWFIRDHGGGSSVVTFAHLTRFKGQKLHDYPARCGTRPLRSTGRPLMATTSAWITPGASSCCRWRTSRPRQCSRRWSPIGTATPSRGI